MANLERQKCSKYVTRIVDTWHGLIHKYSPRSNLALLRDNHISASIVSPVYVCVREGEGGRGPSSGQCVSVCMYLEKEHPKNKAQRGWSGGSNEQEIRQSNQPYFLK